MSSPVWARYLPVLSALVIVLPGYAKDQEEGPSTCSWEASATRVLTVGDRSVFLGFPHAALAGDTMAIVGSTAFSHGRQGFRGESWIGVIVSPEGQGAAIPRPEGPENILTVRVMPLDDGGWRVLWTASSDAAPAGAPPMDDPVASELWEGIFRGGRWEGVERISLPVDARSLRAGASLSFVGADGAAHWVFVAERDGIRRELIILRRDSAGWHQQRYDLQATAIAHAHQPGIGDVVVVGYTDASGRDRRRLISLVSPSEGRVLSDPIETNAPHLQRVWGVPSERGLRIFWGYDAAGPFSSLMILGTQPERAAAFGLEGSAQQPEIFLGPHGRILRSRVVPAREGAGVVLDVFAEQGGPILQELAVEAPFDPGRPYILAGADGSIHLIRHALTEEGGVASSLATHVLSGRVECRTHPD